MTMDIATTNALVGIALYCATNVDDLFILLAFFADPRFRAGQVVAGQCIGMAVLVALSIAAAMLALIVPVEYIGLMGLVPIGMGLNQLLASSQDPEAADCPNTSGSRRTLAVAAVTIANGGDNISAYVPYFAVQSYAQMAVAVVIFAAMTVLWCLASYWLVTHPRMGAPLRRSGHRLLPWVLIAVGIWVIHEAGSVRLLVG